MWFVNIIYWLQAFLSPVIFFGIIGIATGNEQALYLLIGAGVITGIIAAEYIRRKIGLSTFFGRLYGPNEMDEKLKKKNQDKIL